MTDDLWRQLLEQGGGLPADMTLRLQVAEKLGIDPKVALPWYENNNGYLVRRSLSSRDMVVRIWRSGGDTLHNLTGDIFCGILSFDTEESAKKAGDDALTKDDWILLNEWTAETTLSAPCEACFDQHCDGGRSCAIPF